MYCANRNGYFYVLDRATGQFLFGKPFVEVNWAKGLDRKGPADSRRRQGAQRAAGHADFSGQSGRHQLVFAVVQPAHRACSTFRHGRTTAACYVRDKVEYVEGRRFAGGGGRGAEVPGIDGQSGYSCSKENEGYGAVRAIDPKTGDAEVGIQDDSDVTLAGVLTTASNVLFSGGREGYFYALDARTGALLWKVPVGASVRSGPMTYAVGGKQYVTVAAGSAIVHFHPQAVVSAFRRTVVRLKPDTTSCRTNDQRLMTNASRPMSTRAAAGGWPFDRLRQQFGITYHCSFFAGPAA